MERIFDHTYFMREANHFLRQMGSLAFWRLAEEQRENALKGLLYCYTHTARTDDTEAALRAQLMRFATDDFTNRSAAMSLHPRLAA